MTDLEHLVRSALDHEAARAPDGSHLAQQVDERISARRPRSRFGLGARTASLAIAGVALAFMLSSVVREDDPTFPAAPTATPFITTGECSGLAVELRYSPGRDATPATSAHVAWVTGSQQALDLPRPGTLYVHASGPCARDVRYGSPTTTHPVGSHGSASVPLLEQDPDEVLMIVVVRHGAVDPEAFAYLDVSGRTATTTALVGNGECAGLTLDVTRAPATVGGTGQVLMRVRNGSANHVTIDGNDLTYLHATGPCADRVEYQVAEPPGQDAVQGPSGDERQRVNADHTGALISHSTGPATVSVSVHLGCPSGADCRVAALTLAVLTVTVGPPYLGTETSQPAR